MEEKQEENGIVIPLPVQLKAVAQAASKQRLYEALIQEAQIGSPLDPVFTVKASRASERQYWRSLLEILGYQTTTSPGELRIEINTGEPNPYKGP